MTYDRFVFVEFITRLSFVHAVNYSWPLAEPGGFLESHTVLQGHISS